MGHRPVRNHTYAYPIRQAPDSDTRPLRSRSYRLNSDQRQVFRSEDQPKTTRHQPRSRSDGAQSSAVDLAQSQTSHRRGGGSSERPGSDHKSSKIRHRRPGTLRATSVNSALSYADVSIIDQVPDRPIINDKTLSPNSRHRNGKVRQSKREIRDRAIRMLKNPRATLGILGGVQQGIRLFQKCRPTYTGGPHFHIGTVASFLSRYRMFHNVADWISIYEMVKDQRSAGLRGDKLSTIFGWGATAGFAGYLICELLCFAGLTEIFKLSRYPTMNAIRCDDFDRRSAKAFTFWIITKGLHHVREAKLDKRRVRERKTRVPLSELNETDRKLRLDEDVAFEKDLKARRAKRKRFLVINGAWAPAAIHWSLKNSFMDRRTGQIFAVLAQMCKTYYFWGDARA